MAEGEDVSYLSTSCDSKDEPIGLESFNEA